MNISNASLDISSQILTDLYCGTWSQNIVEKRKPPIMAWWLQTMWSSLFGLMVFIAFWGNSIVIWIVLAHRRMRTVTNYFLINLSVADLMMAILNCLFNFLYMLHRDWWFGSFYCIINNYVSTLSVSASVFTLSGITFDRYLAIIRPLKPRMSKRSAYLTILAIWVCSMALALPAILYSKTIQQKTKYGFETHCILIWPDGASNVSLIDKGYNFLLLFVTYFIPMVIMVVCYTMMGKELWGSKAIGEMTLRQLDSIRSKRRVVRMFILIIVIFGICWLPYHAYFIYVNFHSEVMYFKSIQHLYLAFYWLAMANSMVNPIIYYWMNARFRQYFNDVILFRCCCQTSRYQHHGSPPFIYHSSFSKSRSDDYGNNRNVNSSLSGGNKSAHQHCTDCYHCRTVEKTENNVVFIHYPSHRRRFLVGTQYYISQL